MNSTHSNTGVLCMIGSAVFFALGGLLIKLNSMPALSINGLRCFFSFIVLLIYMKLRKHHFVLNGGTLLCTVANAGMCLAFVYANKLTSAANAIVLQFTMPIFIILIMWLFFHRKPEKSSLIACFVSFVGILFFFFDSLTLQGLLGILLAILSGMLYAVVFVSKQIRGCDFESAVLLSFVISFLMALPTILTKTEYTPVNVITVVILGVFQMAVSYILLARGLQSVPPVAASLISMVEPVLNPILVAVFYGELIGPLSLVGAVIVIASATVYNVLEAAKSNKSNRKEVFE
ncbi:MAG: DMT family transporter [Lachnospiraceae bacterium]|nr:DMT family transporter [Lachnospiraceae bacterium]